MTKKISTTIGILIVVLVAGVVGSSVLFFNQEKETIVDYGIVLEENNFIDNSEENISEMKEFTKEDAKKIIQQRIDTWKSEDIEGYTSLLTSYPAPETREDIKKLLKNQGFSPNITEGTVVGIKELPFDLVNTFSSIANYSYHYKETKKYYVAIDYEFIGEENNYIKNGVNYYLYIFGLEDDGWFIIEASSIPVHNVVNAGYGFGTPEEKSLLE